MYMYSRKNTVYSKDFSNFIAQPGTKNKKYFYRENCAFFLASYTAHQLTFHFGGGRVVRWSWINFQVRGVLLVWIRVGQGPTALAVGEGGGCLDIFTLIYPFSFLSPSLWETTRYRLKYCLKGSLSPKTTNQPTFHFSIISDVYIDFIIVCAATIFTFPRTMEIKRTVFSARERSLAWDGILMRTLRLDSQYCNVLLMTLLALISISVVIVKHLLDSATALFVTIHIYFNVQAV